MVQNVIRHYMWKLKDHFYLATPSMLLKTKTLEKKKAIFPVKKRFWPIFSRIIECDKCQGTLCKGPKGILTFIVEVIGSFLKHIGNC